MHALNVFIKIELGGEKLVGLAELALERPQRLPSLGKIDGRVDIFAHSIVVPHMSFGLGEMNKEASRPFSMPASSTREAGTPGITKFNMKFPSELDC